MYHIKIIYKLIEFVRYQKCKTKTKISRARLQFLVSPAGWSWGFLYKTKCLTIDKVGLGWKIKNTLTKVEARWLKLKSLRECSLPIPQTNETLLTILDLFLSIVWCHNCSPGVITNVICPLATFLQPPLFLARHRRQIRYVLLIFNLGLQMYCLLLILVVCMYTAVAIFAKRKVVKLLDCRH